MSGVTRGLQLMVSFLTFLFHALEHGNPEAVKDAITVGKQWLRETADMTGIVKINPMSLIFGSDPWKSSRNMYQALELKWKGKF